MGCLLSKRVEQVSGYDLVERLGGGRGTSLYRGVRPESEVEPRVVVVRVADEPHNPRARAAVEAEAATLGRLVDQRLPRPHGYDPDRVALLVQYVPGITLTDASQAQRDGLHRIDPATAMDILVEIAEAMRAAHEPTQPNGPVAHGHLGAQRVRLTHEGAIVVTGFGANATGRHTAYTSPEMAAGAFPDSRADQWALGAIGVELLLAERLYERHEDARVACLEGDVATYVDRIRRAWPQTGDVLARMLARDPADRYQSDNELCRDLLEAALAAPGAPDRGALVRRVLGCFDRLSATRPPKPGVLPPKFEEESDPGDDLDDAPVETARIIDAVAARASRQSTPGPLWTPAATRTTPVEPVAALKAPTPVSPTPPRPTPTLVPPSSAAQEPVPNLGAPPRPPAQTAGSVGLDDLELEAETGRPPLGSPLPGPAARNDDEQPGDSDESALRPGIAAFQPTEIAGFAMGILLFVLALAFLAMRLG
jgi:serine/threonine protein kinase